MHIRNIHFHSCSAHIAKPCTQEYTTPQVHGNTHLCVFPYSFVHINMPSHAFMPTVTQQSCSWCPCSPTSPEAAASRPHLIRTEGHVGCTWTHGHMGTHAVVPGGITYMCPALHVARYVHTRASRHRHTCLGSHLLSRTATHTPPLMQALPLPPDP